MVNSLKSKIVDELRRRFGQVRKLPGSQSLFEIGDGALTIYFRYSALHNADRTFFGLRKEDLRYLEGRAAAICFLWDGQANPLFLPFADFEEVFASTNPAKDGQYKVQIFLREPSTELYIPRAGKYGVDGYIGWEPIERLIDINGPGIVPELTHAQVQSLLATIGTRKNCDVWLPMADRCRVDSDYGNQIAWRNSLTPVNASILHIMEEVDVIWVERGSGRPRAMFEIEHSTPIYSGLLRFNDIHLSHAQTGTAFSIVSNESRRSLFSRQIQRPTFVTSGLNEICTFMRYDDVYAWYQRLLSADAHQG